MKYSYRYLVSCAIGAFLWTALPAHSIPMKAPSDAWEGYTPATAQPDITVDLREFIDYFNSHSEGVPLLRMSRRVSGSYAEILSTYIDMPELNISTDIMFAVFPAFPDEVRVYVVKGERMLRSGRIPLSAHEAILAKISTKA